ncbi:MAG: flagellar basal body P-ring formation chaperone FlgA [Desulfobacterales bacterium]|nr:flagellar basal body P-ring formation chaperone FlgA [Desulfobacterales bacterium]
MIKNIMHNPSLFIIAVLAALVFFFLDTSWAVEDQEHRISITVLETAEVSGPDILLGEIAKITAPPFFKDGLSKIELGRSPKPGRMKHLTGDKIVSLIRTRGLEDKDLAIDAPKRVFVKRKSQVLKESKVQKEFETFLSTFFTEGEFKLKAFSVRGLEPYPSGNLTLAFEKRYTPGNKGRVSVHADVMVDGAKQDRVTIKGRVALYKAVICAARRLERGEKVSSADVEYKTMDLFELKSSVLESIDEVAPMALTRTIGKGECLTRDVFKQAPTIQKGDIIKLVARKNRLSIITIGVCKENGYADQLVKVENLKSGKMVRGVVKKNGTVEVLF